MEIEEKIKKEMDILTSGFNEIAPPQAMYIHGYTFDYLKKRIYELETREAEILRESLSAWAKVKELEAKNETMDINWTREAKRAEKAEARVKELEADLNREMTYKEALEKAEDLLKESEADRNMLEGKLHTEREYSNKLRADLRELKEAVRGHRNCFTVPFDSDLELYAVLDKLEAK